MGAYLVFNPFTIAAGIETKLKTTTWIRSPFARQCACDYVRFARVVPGLRLWQLRTAPTRQWQRSGVGQDRAVVCGDCLPLFIMRGVCGVNGRYGLDLCRQKLGVSGS